MSFGERLQAVRRRNEMTQEEFAAQLKVSRQAVSKWESSRGYPEIEKIIYICNRYGTTMDELFADEVPTERQEAEKPEPPQELKSRPLKTVLSDFFANLSMTNKLMIGGLLAAAALLVLLISHQLKGETDTMMTIVWTGAIILFGVVEAVTAGLVCIWFVAGALVALIAAFLGATLAIQIVLFLAVSAAALALTRPVLRKITNANAEKSTSHARFIHNSRSLILCSVICTNGISPTSLILAAPVSMSYKRGLIAISTSCG